MTAALRGAAVAWAITVTALAATQGWSAGTIILAYLPCFLPASIVMDRRRRGEGSAPRSPRWTRALLPAAGIATGVAWGVTDDPVYLALGSLTAVTAWSLYPGTLD